MKVHCFYVEEAERHGVEKAVILYNLRYWLEKNKANDSNKHEGYYWTYNSGAAFAELFPYLSKSKVSRLLRQLEDDGLIITGNFNKVSYDRTKWYSMPEFSIVQNCTIHFSYLNNGRFRFEQPIPYINTHIKTDSKHNNQNNDDGINIPFEVFWDLYDKKINAGKCKKKWEKLTDDERRQAVDHVPQYVKSTPDKQFRRAPLVYLNNEGWLDEVIMPNSRPASNHWSQPVRPNQDNFDNNSNKLSIEEQRAAAEAAARALALRGIK